MLDLYGGLLAKVLFPTFEAARGRPTVQLLRYLRSTERWSLAALRDLQVGLLRRLLHHAYAHTSHYRDVMDARGIRASDIVSVDDLGLLPLLDRDTVRSSMERRTAVAPPLAVITKRTSGTTGEPVTVKYNAESRHWRDATRWRGYGWGGYRIGMRALHYWGSPLASKSWFGRRKLALDHALKRDHYVDCIPRGEAALAAVVASIRRDRPQVIVAYAAGAAALARFVNELGQRVWRDIPVIVGAERLWPHDRTAIEQAFGPAFETYGCREVMLIAAECEAHAGMHSSMEKLVVELIVRETDGTIRPARPGETGEVAVTDLHNLACPMIRYTTGDLAVAHDDDVCACGRRLMRLGPIDGRVTQTLHDARGNPVGGMVFSVLLAQIDLVVSRFQVLQRLDGSVVMKVVPIAGDRLPDKQTGEIHAFANEYLCGAPFAIEVVGDIPLTAAGKREVVVVERAH